MPRRSLILAGAGCAILLGVVAWNVSATTYRPLIIGAMPPGSSWYVFAATLGQLLEQKLPAGTGVEIFARGGGTGNPVLVERGKASIALCQVATAVWAWEGEQISFRGIQHRRIRALVGGLNSVWMTAAVRRSWAERAGATTLEQMLKARPAPRIIMKPPGSTVPAAADMILKFHGLTRGDIRANGGAIIQIAVNQIPEMLADGRADLYFETAIKGHPALTEAATTGDIRFVDFSPELLKNLAERGMKPRPLPAWFKGQDRPTEAVDCGTVLIARDDLPEETAYLIAKTICENRAAMIRAHKAWADFEPEKAGRIEATGIPLHAGAARYFRERGWL